MRGETRGCRDPLGCYHAGLRRVRGMVGMARARRRESRCLDPWAPRA